MSAVCVSVADTANVISNATYGYKLHFATGRVIR
jgi:hypothetical protein